MAKAIQTLSPEFIDELIWTVNKVKALVNGGLRGQDDRLSRASDGVVIVTPESGISPRYNETMYGEWCYLYRILDTDHTDDEITLEAILDGSGNCLRQKVFNASETAVDGDTYQVSELFRSGHRYINQNPGISLTGGCLAQDHPGRGTPFSIHLGTWQASTDAWLYDTEATVTAIDWRYGVPYPDAGATGLFWPRKSDTYGTIWEVVSLDCESPGECNGDYPT